MTHDHVHPALATSALEPSRPDSMPSPSLRPGRLGLRRSGLLTAAALCLALAAGCSRTERAEPSGGHFSSDQAAVSEAVAEGGPIGAPATVAPQRASKGKKRHEGEAAHAQTPAAEGAPLDFEMKEEEPADAVWLDRGRDAFNTEAYDSIQDNRFVSVKTAPLSTFSIDVDTASYSNVRRFLEQGAYPPAGAVRIEELVNYFDYEYEDPRGENPFSVVTEVSTAPWAPEHQLLHIGLQGKRMALEALPPRNLVFLLDVSGSMNEPNKLPLLKRSLSALLDTMEERDTVSIVVYAGASGMVLPPTSAHNRRAIQRALESLEAGGSTNGGEGIELAYRLAERSFTRGGVSRVILATDGDFNVGPTNQSDLVKLIEKKRETGVFLTVLGFGMGNYKDSTLEKLADHGNGNYAYIDSFREARKVLVEEGGANLVTIAKDVKIQVEMNPAVVGAYRLIGYENRVLAAEDFNDDTKDAGEIGAGHTVTALYEVMSPEQAAAQVGVDELKYQPGQKWQSLEGGWPSARPSGAREDSPRRAAPGGAELATVKLRYKTPQGSRSTKLEVVVPARTLSPGQTSESFRFSAAVASFGMLLRGSEYRGASSYRQVRQLAAGAVGRDEFGHRREFLKLVEQAARL